MREPYFHLISVSNSNSEVFMDKLFIKWDDEEGWDEDEDDEDGDDDGDEDE